MALYRLCLSLLVASLPAFGSLGAPVPLTITDRSGVARTNEGVTTGVPLPASANVLDVRNLMLTTSSAGNCSGGSTVDSMLHAVERWNGSPTDVTKPIRWVWVETVVPSLAANASVVYCLKDRAGSDPGTTALTVTNTGGFITVNTGAMTFKVSTTAFNFLDTVTVGSTPVITPAAANTWQVVANGVTYTSSNTDGTYAATVEYPGVTPDANSAGENVRAQIKVSGKFTSAGAVQKFLYEMRIVAYSGGTSIAVRPVLTFSEDMFATANKPTAITLSLPLALGGGTRNYTYGANTGTSTGTMVGAGTDDVYLLQYDHGHGTPSGLKGYTIVKNGTSTGAENYQAQGWADINDGSLGATVWVRDFWQRYPMELEVNGSTLNVHLWPAHGVTGVSGVGDGTSPLGQIFAEKRDASLSSANTVMARNTGSPWPYTGGAAMDLTPLAPNPLRLVSTVAQGPATVISSNLNVNTTYTCASPNPSCHLWPSGTTQRVYLAQFTGCWAALNGFHVGTNTGTLSGSGYPLISIDADTSACSLPVTPALMQGLGSDPTISNIDTLTDMQAQGTAQEWEIKYQFYAGTVPTAANTAATLKDRLMLVNPAWLASSQAFGRIKEVDTAEFPLAEANYASAWTSLTTNINSLNLYGINYGDFNYDPTTPPTGVGSRWFAFSRKGWELVPWMMYARTGDPQYLNWGTSITSHGINVDLQHVTVALYTDANNNPVIKHVGAGICTHGATHWWPTYYSAYAPGGYDCSEGEEPTLDYVADAAEAMYVFTAHDRSKQIALEQLAFTTFATSSLATIPNDIGGRSFGGCLTLASAANRLAWTGTALGEACFAGAVKHTDGTQMIGNPVGYVIGSGNEWNWTVFSNSWVGYSFPEFAEQDPSYCANDANSVSHCVRAEFNRFAEAFTGMGKTSDTTGSLYYGLQGKSPSNAYAYTSNGDYLKHTQKIFQQFLQPGSFIIGAALDVHYWAPYMLNLPFAEGLLSGRVVSPPDNSPYPVTIPSDGMHTVNFLVNKTVDQPWTFTLSIDTGNDQDTPYFLAGTVTVDVLNPSAGPALHTTVSACTYGGPTPCIPNSTLPVESSTTTVGHGMSVTYGGVDNRVLTFTVPSDGLTGEYTIKLSVVNGVGGTCNGGANDRYTCYSTTHFAFPMGSSLGSLTMVTPSIIDPDCSLSPYQTPHVGRGLYYFKVASGALQISASTSMTNSFLLSPSGKYYQYGSTNTVSPEPGMWAIATNSQLDDGWGVGECISLKGVKPLLAASPQVYYDSPSQTISSTIYNYGGEITVNFSGSACSITTTTLPAGTVGTGYWQAIGTSGCQAPVTWSVTAGTLCNGLSLGSGTGILSGTPSTPQTCSFTVQASDSGGNTFTQSLAQTIAASSSVLSSGAATTSGTIRQ